MLTCPPAQPKTCSPAVPGLLSGLLLVACSAAEYRREADLQVYDILQSAARGVTGDAKTFNIDLGRINTPIDNDTLLADLNNGAGVTISDDDTNNDIKFIDRDLTEYEVDLTGITTVGGLISRVNLETGGHIQISIHADGDKFTVTDTVGRSGNLKVLGAGTNNTQTAEDLGILNEAGVAADSFDGQLIPNSVQDARAVTL